MSDVTADSNMTQAPGVAEEKRNLGGHRHLVCAGVTSGQLGELTSTHDRGFHSFVAYGTGILDAREWRGDAGLGGHRHHVCTGVVASSAEVMRRVAQRHKSV